MINQTHFVTMAFLYKRGFEHQAEIIDHLVNRVGLPRHSVYTGIQLYIDATEEQHEQLAPLLQRHEEIYNLMKTDIDQGISLLGNTLYDITLVFFPDFREQIGKMLEEINQRGD